MEMNFNCPMFLEWLSLAESDELPHDKGRYFHKPPSANITCLKSSCLKVSQNVGVIRMCEIANLVTSESASFGDNTRLRSTQAASCVPTAVLWTVTEQVCLPSVESHVRMVGLLKDVVKRCGFNLTRAPSSFLLGRLTTISQPPRRSFFFPAYTVHQFLFYCCFRARSCLSISRRKI
jgi:hypothetical protein